MGRLFVNMFYEVAERLVKSAKLWNPLQMPLPTPRLLTRHNTG